MSATKPQTTIDRLRERIPEIYIRQRKQGGTTLSYVSWYDACNLLDERAPGWSMEIKGIGEIAGKVYVRVALTIEGVTRENIGCEDEELKGYGDVFSNSVGMALRRAAALFGLGRHLYDKDDKPTQRQAPRQAAPALRSPAAPDQQCEQTANKPGKPAEPIAKTMADLTTPKQLIAIRAIANANGLNAETHCLETLNCRPEELSRAAASWFIDQLKSQDKSGEPSKPESGSGSQPQDKGDFILDSQVYAITSIGKQKKFDIHAHAMQNYGVPVTAITGTQAAEMIRFLNSVKTA